MWEVGDVFPNFILLRNIDALLRGGGCRSVILDCGIEGVAWVGLEVFINHKRKGSAREIGAQMYLSA